MLKLSFAGADSAISGGFLQQKHAFSSYLRAMESWLAVRKR